MKQVEPPELQSPDHIAPQLMFDFGKLRAPATKQCPHRSMNNLCEDEPRIFYTQRNGGHWIATRADDALDMPLQTENFSSDPNFCKAQVREHRTNPNRCELHEHAESRKIASPVTGALSLRELSQASFGGEEQNEHWHSSPGRSG